MDFRLDKNVWKDAARLAINGDYDIERCQLCDNPASYDTAVYQQAAGAFTNYKFLCRNCALTLGLLTMINE